MLKVMSLKHNKIISFCKMCVSKAARQVGLLGRVRRYITTSSANATFLSMIRPTLEYCAGVWGCCGELKSGILETLQKRHWKNCN